METGRMIWWHELPDITQFSGDFKPLRKGWSIGGHIVSIPYDATVTITKDLVDRTEIAYNGSIYVCNTALVDRLPTAKAGDMITFRSPVIMLSRPIYDPTEYDFRWIYSNKLRMDVEGILFLVVKEDRGWLQLNSGAWITKSVAWLADGSHVEGSE